MLRVERYGTMAVANQECNKTTIFVTFFFLFCGQYDLMLHVKEIIFFEKPIGQSF